MLKIHIQRKAQQDLENIWLYSFKQWGEKKADEYYDDLIEAINYTLLHNNNIGVDCDYIRTGYRQYQVNEHLIFYKLTSAKIHIIRVLYKGMKFEKHISH